MIGGGRRALVMAVVMVSAWAAGAPPAGADPAVPTDYRAEVTAVDPAVDGLRVRIVGGDAFVELSNDTGSTVDVVGYQGEPYLRFLPDGTVQENAAAPTTALNRDRLPSADAADGASADPAAPPDWRTVASGGTYAWHDHRAHWMSPVPPLGRSPGDEVLDGTVPLVVDGDAVTVRVRVRWERAPSPLPAVIGAALALTASVVAARRSPRPGLPAVALVVATAASVAAWTERSTLGSIAAGPLTLTVLPTVAGAVAAIGLAGGRRSGERAGRVAGAAAMLAGLELVVWAVARRAVLGAAVLPTGGNAAFDRAATAAALVGGAAVAGLAGWALVRPVVPVGPAGAGGAGGAGGRRPTD